MKYSMRKALGIAVTIMAIMVGLPTTPAGAVTAPSLTRGNPVDCPAAQTVKTVTSRTSGNKYEARYSAPCDGVWVRMNNQTILDGWHTFIVAYDCIDATGSCRSQDSARAISTTGGWTRMLDVSDHAAFRICWDDEVNAPYNACSSSFTIDAPRGFETWNGTLSPLEGPPPEFTVNRVGDHLCVITESSAADIRVRTFAPGDDWWKTTYNSWTLASTIDDYYCRTVTNMSDFHINACNGRACGFSAGLDENDLN